MSQHCALSLTGDQCDKCHYYILFCSGFEDERNGLVKHHYRINSSTFLLFNTKNIGVNQAY